MRFFRGSHFVLVGCTIQIFTFFISESGAHTWSYPYMSRSNFDYLSQRARWGPRGPQRQKFQVRI